MEAVTNTAIGFVISMIAWHFVALAFSIPMPIGQNLIITGIFTVISLVRQYVLRRLFDGKTVWQSIRDQFTTPTMV
jgi:NO-binding membrane sensor protein with MHYT domain